MKEQKKQTSPLRATTASIGPQQPTNPTIEDTEAIDLEILKEPAQIFEMEVESDIFSQSSTSAQDSNDIKNIEEIVLIDHELMELNNVNGSIEIDQCQIVHVENDPPLNLNEIDTNTIQEDKTRSSVPAM